MKPLLHPMLVNDPFGDPAVYVEFLFARRAFLLDLGELDRLPARKLLRVSDVFVSHTHMDHFIGFDRLVRVCVGRDRRLNLYGPAGFVDQVGHRLQGYSWNLVDNYDTDFTLVATEVTGDSHARLAEFHCRQRFALSGERRARVDNGMLLDEDNLRVRCAVLDHRIPCLAFALEEKRHVNVWKNRLDALGLPVGPWLQELKAAVLRDAPPDTPIHIRWREQGVLREAALPLGELAGEVLRIVPGQKIAYVTDVIHHAENAARITALARDADLLFIEAPFLDADRTHAAAKYHLTARQAGQLARAARAKRVVPFHFSARYAGRPAPLLAELSEAFSGGQAFSGAVGWPQADPT